MTINSNKVSSLWEDKELPLAISGPYLNQGELSGSYVKGRLGNTGRSSSDCKAAAHVSTDMR